MAPKRPPPMEHLPSASSSEDEEASSGEEEESDEQEEQKEKTLKHPPKPTSPVPPPQQQLQQQQPKTQTAKSTPKKPESKNGSDEDSESESESEPELPVKPMEETPSKAAEKKPRSKQPTAAAATPGKSKDPKDSKRPGKKQDSEKSEDAKKQLFQRLWSDDDEIALLKGIIDFTAEKGIDPSKDRNAFFNYIKKSLHFNVSMEQLRKKISSLKMKFENRLKGKNGEEKTFSKPHDQNSFDLSKKIWGSEGISGGAEAIPKANGKRKSGNNNNNDDDNNQRGNGKKMKMEDRVNVERNLGAKKVLKFDNTVGAVVTMEDYIVRRGLDAVDGEKRAEMEEEWRKLHVAELELFLKRNELVRKQAKLMLAAYKIDDED